MLTKCYKVRKPNSEFSDANSKVMLLPRQGKLCIFRGGLRTSLNKFPGLPNQFMQIKFAGFQFRLCKCFPSFCCQVFLDQSF